MFKKCMIALLFLFGIGFAYGADLNIFTGNSDGTSWDDPNNWSLIHPPVYNTNSSEYTYIGRNASGDLDIIIDDDARGGKAWLGRPEDPDNTYTLNLVGDDAFYYLVRLYIGPRGVLVQDAGEFDTWEGRFQDSEIVINGGLFTIRSSSWAFFDSSTYSAPGLTTINGGTMRIKNGSTFSKLTTASKPYNPEFTGVWDLCGGEVVMDGDVESELGYHITYGNIVAYGGSPDYTPEPVYSSSTGTTRLSAAAINVWTGAGDGSTWHDPNNWSFGAMPTYNTDHSMLTYIGKGAVGDCTITIDKNLEDDATRAHSGRAWLGRPEDPEGTYTLNIPEEGEYYLVRHYVGPKGILNINGGTYNAWEGRYDGCRVNINSGEFIVRGPLWNFFNSSVTTISGGALRIQNGDDFSHYADGIDTRNPNFTGTWDLCGGKVVMDGDCRQALQWHIDNGNIIAYGGTDPDFELDMVYDSATDTTILNSNTMVAKNPWPSDGMELTLDDRYIFQLNWKPGKDIKNLTGYNVYIADPNGPDPNVIELVLVSDPVSPYGDTSWQITDAVLGQTYSWRIDTVTNGGANIITGEVWSVTIDEELLSLYSGSHLGGTLDYQWIGCGDGTSWNDELNWHCEFPDPNTTIPLYSNHEGDLIESRMEGTITTDWSLGGTMFLGYGVDQTVNVATEGALWQLYRLYLWSDGTVNIQKDCTAYWVRLNLDGGEVNVNGRLEFIGGGWYIKQTSAGEGGINVLDGTVVMRKMPEAFPFREGETGNIDIYDGTVIFDCNEVTSDTATVQSWIDDGYITAFGGEDNSVVDMYVDEEAEVIYLTAREDGRVAYSPLPADKELSWDADESLSWISGLDSTEDTLYLSKKLRADITGDDNVDIDDIFVLSEYYLAGSWDSQGDISNDGQVNLRDLAIMSSEWLSEQSLSLIDSISPGSPASYSVPLDYDSEYIWRVDSTIEGETVTGNTWSFKTCSDPLLASNEYPVDGDDYVCDTTVTLTWQTDDAIDSCNVYFAESCNQAASASSYQTNTTSGEWVCPSLTVGKRYYWRVDTVEGAAVHSGKVWSFKVGSTPLGLYVEGGVLKHNGSQFKGYGVNYINPFIRCLQDTSDTSYKEGFRVLGDKGIPFVRMWGSGFHVSDWTMYFEDKDKYFAILDDVMLSAEENNVGVIFSMFWYFYTLPDLVGEHMNEWQDTSSQTYSFMETYIRELYERYKNCPSFWGWEFGNEYNLWAERNILATESIMAVYGHPTSQDTINPVYRDNTLDRMDMTMLRQLTSNFYTAVRKVDANRMVTNGFSLRLDPSNSSYGLPERQIDHEMVDVASIHYYGHTDNGANPGVLYDAATDTASWGQPLFVGEFGVNESADLNEVHDGGYASVQEAITDMVNDMVSNGVTFACAWVYDFSERNKGHEIRTDNNRSYVLDVLSDANAAMNP